MSVYNTGSVRVKVGSAEVRGYTTSFSSYISAGYVFKVTGENVFYTVAAVTNATKLTLSSRYANSTYQTARVKKVATAIIGDLTYSGILANTPVIQSRVTIRVEGKERFRDNGAGILTGSLGGLGSIGYDDGAWAIVLGAGVSGNKTINASYFSGDTLDSQSYQIVKDYTSYFRLPEADPVDQNLAYLYTKAVRMIDEKLYNASQNSASIKNIVLHNNIKSKARSKSANYVATSTDRWVVFTGNTASVNLTLFNASAKNKFKEAFIINNSSYVVRILRQNSNNINASSVIKLKTRYKTFHGYVATTGLWIRER